MSKYKSNLIFVHKIVPIKGGHLTIFNCITCLYFTMRNLRFETLIVRTLIIDKFCSPLSLSYTVEFRFNFFPPLQNCHNKKTKVLLQPSMQNFFLSRDHA